MLALQKDCFVTRPAIRVEGLWKEYVVGGKPVGQTFREAVVDVIKTPLLRLAGRDNSADERFWALQNVSFEIAPGEVAGIIGRNGAGKSTLLKILSRITAPTRGHVEINGRVASLLEVGTGFHPELTGRENIRLNGAILGMRGSEISRKFDEIVDFSGVEKFIDTPVKRYSSGMQVRLAFAVAAHLDPEILLVDEVLAVGDAEFQKKCLGKLDEIAHRGGRTVLFVSHQMGMVSRLCETGIYFKGGRLVSYDRIDRAISSYSADTEVSFRANERKGRSSVFVESVITMSQGGDERSEFLFDEPIVLRCCVRGKIDDAQTVLSATLLSKNGDFICSAYAELETDNSEGNNLHVVEFFFPPKIFAPKNFSFRIGLATLQGKIFDHYETVCPIKVIDNGSPLARYEMYEYGQVIVDVTTSVRSSVTVS
jgi:lipopolysaccharide transport system ATP-binding protein